MMKRRILLITTFILIIAGTTIIISACRKEGESVTYETAKAQYASVVNTISATGTLEATTTVDVGTQVSGIVEKLYVDFNSEVKKGQLLAQIDETSLRTSVKEAEATLDNAKAEVEYQESNFERVKALYDKKLVSQADYDEVKYNYDKAKASLKSAQANYDKVEVNLGYAKIYSPIDGVVMNRAVDEGQTVAASFETPTIFSIAKNLTEMKVEADIDQADIGQVKLGQRVEFTVDAYRGEIFGGEILEIRLEPVESSNVITYTVIINAPNPEKKLMPGMTALITVYVEEIKNVLTVPNKALRFSPGEEMIEAAMEINKDQSYVWVRDGDSLIKPLIIEEGASDGTKTAIESGISEGEEVITGMTVKTNVKAEKQSSNPFMPQPPGGKDKKEKKN